jgi:hypothetical protein
MSEAPLEWPATAYILHPSVQTYGDLVSNPERRKYIRADLVDAAIKRALGEAMRIDAEYWKGSSRVSDLIAELDPAQFIEEPKG